MIEFYVNTYEDFEHRLLIIIAKFRSFALASRAMIYKMKLDTSWDVEMHSSA